jgi:hypothetical protein
VVDDEEPRWTRRLGRKGKEGTPPHKIRRWGSLGTGKRESQVVVSWVARLPNGGAIWPEDKFHVVG